MPEDFNKISRRSFLKVSGVGLATLASRPVWAQGASEAHDSTRNKPAEPLVLRSRALELVLDRKDGLPFEYRLLPSKSRFIGEDLGTPLKAVICDRARWAFRSVPLAVSKVNATNSQANFQFNVTDEGKPAASFTLRYSMGEAEATVHIALDGVQEHAGYELIQVELPRLVTVRLPWRLAARRVSVERAWER